MGLSAFEAMTNEAGVKAHVITCVGGSSAISKSSGGAGMTVSRSGTGAYALAWDDVPGTFIGAIATLSAATPGDLAGHTVIADTYASSSLPFIVYNASDSAHDLAANEYVTIVAFFKTVSV